MAGTFVLIMKNLTFSLIRIECCNQYKDTPCRVALVGVKNSEIVEQKEFFIDPLNAEFDFMTSGTTLEDLRGKGLFAEQFPALLDIPMSAVDEFIYNPWYYCAQKYPAGNEHLTLRLQGENGLYKQFYKNNVKVNTQTEYTFRFLSDTLLDTRCIFVIKNKEFYCKELHHTISTEKISKEVEGIFYLVEES